jgi:hypothetical protein
MDHMMLQSILDFEVEDGEEHQPKLFNGYTQIFVKAGANVTHSYVEESGGVVTPGTELSNKDLADGAIPP